MSAAAEDARRIALDILNPAYFTIIVTASACLWYAAAVFKVGRHPKGIAIRGMAVVPIAYAVYDFLAVHHNHARETAVAWSYAVVLLVVIPAMPCAVAMFACKVAPFGAVPLAIFQAWPAALMASSFAYIYTGGGADNFVPFAVPVVLVGVFVMAAHIVHSGEDPPVALLVLVWLVESAALALVAVAGLRTVYQREEAVPETISRHADAAGVLSIVAVLSLARIAYMAWADGLLRTRRHTKQETEMEAPRPAVPYTGKGAPNLPGARPADEETALLWKDV